MRKYQKAAVVVAMLGSVSFLGAGVGHAGGGGCEMNDYYESVLGVDDIGVNVNLLLAHGDVEQDEKESMHCKSGH